MLPERQSDELISLRQPVVADGKAMWQLVREMGGLELNTAYFYLLYCRDYAASCVVAEDDGALCGFALGHRPPTRPDSLFIWQIGVAPTMRQRGVAQRMLRQLLAQRKEHGWRYLEASVSPDNRASRRLFSGLAEDLRVRCEVFPYLTAQQFPEGHPREDLMRIGPFSDEDLT